MKIFTDEFKQHARDSWEKSTAEHGARMQETRILLGVAILASLIAAVILPIFHVSRDWIAAAWLLGAGIWFYMLPGYVAWVRYHNNLLAIWWLNILLGWSVVGWIISLVWACTKDINRDPAKRIALFE